MSRTIIVQAPAKLNLALSVGPIDAAGMHPICSWMLAVNYCDELTVTRLEADRLSRYAILWHAEAPRRSDINWPIGRDLAVRAHQAIERLVGRSLPVQLKLEKRIPVGGGLGGGSSNAAAMLHAVNTLFDLSLSEDDLIEIGATLGSDVPFLISAIRGGSAIVSGLGQEIHRQAESAPLHAVLVLPDASCPTAEVYRAFDDLAAGVPPRSVQAERVRRLAAAAAPPSVELFNDLTEPACRVAPNLKMLLRNLSALAERPAHLSGSGSTIFIICDNELHAQALAQSIESRLELPATAVRSYQAAAMTAESRREL